MHAELQSYITPEDYLEGEKISPVKHEYIDGQVYAMAGVTDAHATIALNLAVMLRGHVRGSRCRVFIADMKARIEPANTFYYPDVLVTCDEQDRQEPLAKKRPCLVVEVLSDSTEGIDRGRKFARYRRLDSLQEYVLIAQDHQSVEIFRRNELGQWVLYSFATGQEVHLESLDFRCPIEALYEDVELPE